MLLKILDFWVAGAAELGRIAGVAVSQNITVHHFAGRPIVGLFAGLKDSFKPEMLFNIDRCVMSYFVCYIRTLSFII